MPSELAIKKSLSDSNNWLKWTKEMCFKTEPSKIAEVLIRNHFSLSSILATFHSESLSIQFDSLGDLAGHSEWLSWLGLNMARNADPIEIRDILLVNGFTADSIRQCMADRFPADAFIVLDYSALSNPPLLVKSDLLQIWSAPFKGIQLYTIENFLTAAQCAELISIAKNSFRPSGVLLPNEKNSHNFNSPNVGAVLDFGYRNSQTADLGLIPNPLVIEVDKKICKTLGISDAYSEYTQIQWYGTGQEYKYHKDYFQPGTDELTIYAGPRGNRTWTFMVYLNEGMAGGETHFSDVDLMIIPRIGTAVIWNNLLPNGQINPLTTHAGLPVQQGEKYVITKWFREYGLGPLFIDDASS